MARMSKAKLAEMAERAAQAAAWHAERERWYPVTADGREVQPGDQITNFRGEVYQFDLVTAHPEGSSAGKIAVRGSDGRPVVGGEHYPSVFDLKLVRTDDES